MSRFMRCALFAAAALWSASGTVPATADAKPADTLGRFVGTWRSSATLVKSDYSSAGTAHGTTTCVWSMSKEFVICQQAVVVDGALSHDIAIYSYDPAAKHYTFHTVGVSNASDSTIEVTSKSVVYPSSFKDKGHTVTMRTVNEWRSPNRYDFRTEFSIDGGKHWTTMLSGFAYRIPTI